MIMIMNNKTNQQVVYLLSICDRDLQETNSYGVPVKIYSNLDLAIKKALDIHFNDEQILDTLVSLSNIAFDSTSTTATTEDVNAAIIEVLHKTINSTYDFTHQHISKKLFLKVKHLIPNPNKYNQQDLYDEFIEFYVKYWEILFHHYGVNSDNIQTKIQKMVDDRNKFYQIKHNIESDKNQPCGVASKLTKSYLKKRYPKLSFNNGRYSDTFEFSINSFVNEVFGFKLNQTFIIETFVLDKDDDNYS